ncbi:ABC transporter ATP-binding protein [Texcoconibacillus texcoconensis]|uniref:NitT/TauT family transport system ATP-binding protein n=1 Tax=Texcoconibacillus texcoconensis TaxID=1095777 RepID=A0A840QN65_9BACI|nr:ABC transporter ATP-binding protein [Texcoconibacillus texcoconensis]MBB5172825.1 NitT/TauT family transport system ATP-binding protein [Texcoconibacillus texcoconensis]
MTFLNVSNLQKVFFQKSSVITALEDIDLTVNEGEFISIIGPSGCGKSTLLSIIAGLLPPTRGTVQINGETVDQPSPSTGYMLQQDYLYPWLSIKENVMIGLKTMGIYNEKNEQATLHLLDEVGLFDRADDYPAELSGGMRQRVALVRMLATQPKLLLLDEPFSALDYQTKLKMEDLVFEMIRSRNKSALLVTHDIGEAIAMSDRIYLLTKQPAHIQRTFVIDRSLRESVPFEARQHETFNDYFQDIWQEMEGVNHGSGSQ